MTAILDFLKQDRPSQIGLGVIFLCLMFLIFRVHSANQLRAIETCMQLNEMANNITQPYVSQIKDNCDEGCPLIERVPVWGERGRGCLSEHQCNEGDLAKLRREYFIYRWRRAIAQAKSSAERRRKERAAHQRALLENPELPKKYEDWRKQKQAERFNRSRDITPTYDSTSTTGIRLRNPSEIIRPRTARLTESGQVVLNQLLLKHRDLNREDNATYQAADLCAKRWLHI